MRELVRWLVHRCTSSSSLCSLPFLSLGSTFSLVIGCCVLGVDLHGHHVDVDVVHGLVGDQDRVLDVVIVYYVRYLLPLKTL